MQIRFLAFAQAHDLLGFREKIVECAPADSAGAIVRRVAPALDLRTMRVAVDCEYCDWDKPIGEASEIALIPPVSGG